MTRTRTPRSRRCLAALLAPVLALLLALGSACGAPGAPSEQGRLDPTSPASSSAAPAQGPDQEAVSRALAALEEDGARVGVYAVEVDTGRELSYRADARVAHASTFKALLAGVLLDRLTGRELAQKQRWRAADLVANSPVTERHVADGLSVRRLLAAMLVESDNTAANVLLDLVGGPDGLERALRALGDGVTSTDRYETDLGSAVPGETLDTSTPRALVASLRALLLGDVLADERVRLLEGWMRRSVTGEGLVRAAVPGDWTVGDRSGTASYGTRNNLAFVLPPGRGTILVSVMTTHPDDADAEPDDALVARAARIVLDELADG